MKRRSFLKSITAGSMAASLATSARGQDQPETASRPPNVLLILADDLSAKELSCHGNDTIHTPRIDALGRSGVQFRTAWSAPLCGPSRAQMQTGKYAYQTGYFDNTIRPKTPFYRSHLTLGAAMKQRGYRTAMYGKIHHGGDPREYGFDEYCAARYWEGYDGPNQALGPPTRGMYAIQWYWHPGLVHNGQGIPTTPDQFGPDIEARMIREFMTAHREDPFFIYWPTNLIHMEHFAPNGWRYADVPEMDEHGRPTGRKVKGSTKSTTEYLDHLVGTLVDHLEGLGLRENTVVFFVGDNGTAEYGKNRLESEKAIHVPFVVNGPGLVESLGPRDELVDLTDVLPTLADLAGKPLPAEGGFDGHSFAPLLRGEPFVPREWIFAQLNEARWLRDTRWLLDGNGSFHDCGSSRGEWLGYGDVTRSVDAEVIAARKRFEAILHKLPPPDYDDPETAEAWKRHFATVGRHKPYRPPYLDANAPE